MVASTRVTLLCVGSSLLPKLTPRIGPSDEIRSRPVSLLVVRGKGAGEVKAQLMFEAAVRGWLFLLMMATTVNT